MADIVPVEVPTVHQVKATLQTAHARHLAVHRAHHHLAQRVAGERTAAIAASRIPSSVNPLSGTAGNEGPPPSSGGFQ